MFSFSFPIFNFLIILLFRISFRSRCAYSGIFVIVSFVQDHGPLMFELGCLCYCLAWDLEYVLDLMLLSSLSGSLV